MAEEKLLHSTNTLLSALSLPFTLESLTECTPSLILAIFESMTRTRLPISSETRRSRSRGARVESMKILLGVMGSDVLAKEWGETLEEVDPRRLAEGDKGEVEYVLRVLCWLGRKMGVVKSERRRRREEERARATGMEQVGDVTATSTGTHIPNKPPGSNHDRRGTPRSNSNSRSSEITTAITGLSLDTEQVETESTTVLDTTADDHYYYHDYDETGFTHTIDFHSTPALSPLSLSLVQPTIPSLSSSSRPHHLPPQIEIQHRSSSFTRSHNGSDPTIQFDPSQTSPNLCDCSNALHPDPDSNPRTPTLAGGRVLAGDGDGDVTADFCQCARSHRPNDTIGEPTNHSSPVRYDGYLSTISAEEEIRSFEASRDTSFYRPHLANQSKGSTDSQPSMASTSRRTLELLNERLRLLTELHSYSTQAATVTAQAELDAFKFP